MNTPKLDHGLHWPR